jgi:hypothetical protein
MIPFLIICFLFLGLTPEFYSESNLNLNHIMTGIAIKEWKIIVRLLQDDDEEIREKMTAFVNRILNPNEAVFID